MSYYEKFKPGPDTAIGKLSARVKSLAEEIPRFTKRLADEKNNSLRLKNRIAELESRAGEILIDDKNAYEKYRTSLRKLNRELETSISMINSLSWSLPSKQTEFRESKHNLRVLLDAYLLRSRPVADAKINELLKDCLVVIQDFLASFTQIYLDCGMEFIASNDDFYPGPFSGQQVRDMCLSLGFVISRTGTISAPTKPPESDSQAVEAQNPHPEASGTKLKPGMTLLT